MQYVAANSLRDKIVSAAGCCREPWRLIVTGRRQREAGDGNLWTHAGGGPEGGGGKGKGRGRGGVGKRGKVKGKGGGRGKVRGRGGEGAR